MAMNSRQIYNRLNQAFESDYKQYEDEAEWYGEDDEHIWRFHIPSINVTVMLTLEEANKRVVIAETIPPNTVYKVVGNYSW